MVLLNIDLLLKYFYPTANIELFINLTSHPIRKLLSTLSHSTSLSLSLTHFSFFRTLSIPSFHSVDEEHDETSRDIHFGAHAVKWKQRAEWKEWRKMPLENWNRTTQRDKINGLRTRVLLQQRHFKWFTRLHSVIDVIAKSPKCKQTFSLFLFALVVALYYIRADKFLFDHKKRKSEAAAAATATTQQGQNTQKAQTQRPEAHVFVDWKVPAFSFHFILALFRQSIPPTTSQNENNKMEI